jgi:hypothetical protein
MPDPGRVLRRALLGWGLGHLALGRTAFGISLLVAEIVAIGLVAWLAVGLADTSAYLVPFLAGIAFLVAWAWQAVAAYRAARRIAGDPSRVPDRSPALAMGWLAVPLLIWGAGFWLVGASASSPSAVLDRFVTDWTAGALAAGGYPPEVVDAAGVAESSLDDGAERFRDLRLRIDERGTDHATAVAEAIHYERRDARFLGLFAGSELVPVADRDVLLLDLAARPVELPGGGDVGAVRWELTGARVPGS